MGVLIAPRYLKERFDNLRIIDKKILKISGNLMNQDIALYKKALLKQVFGKKYEEMIV